MLNSLVVENFRLFTRLEITHFGRVNLFVGKNNSGKSALLEAIEIYASGGSVSTLQALTAARAEDWNRRRRYESQPVDSLYIRHLFHGHQLPSVGEPGIVVRANSIEDDMVSIEMAAYQTVTNEEGFIQRVRLTPSQFLDADGEVETALVSHYKGRVRRIVTMSRQENELNRSVVRSVPDGERQSSLQTVPTQNMSADTVASLWDAIGLTDMAAEVIAGLQLIEPSIKNVAFVEGVASRDNRVPLVRTDLSSEPLPLKSMGDGLTRVFHIIVALANAKDGILLVDEFENGLHWSVQPSVWKSVFRLAEALNVQIFATSHSSDCVKSFQEAWLAHRDEGAFFRMDRNREGVADVQTYSLETLADSVDTRVEVR